MEIDQELYDQTLERVEAMEALAERILSECRVTLMVSFRFLDRALWKLPYKSLRFTDKTPNLKVSTCTTLATDGHALYYNAKAVIRAFRMNPDFVIRSYLHSLIHCIFRHPFRTVRAETDLWSLACDICTEAIALEMCAGRFSLEGDEAALALANHIAEGYAGLTPNKVYRMLLLGKTEQGNPDQLHLYAQANGNGDLFARDDHHLWDLVRPPKDEETPPEPPAGGSDDGSQNGEPQDDPDKPDDADTGDAPEGNEQESDAEPNENPDSSDGGNAGEGGQDDQQEQQPQMPHDQPAPPQQQAEAPEPEYSEGEELEPVAPTDDSSDEEDWEQIAKQVETELHTMEKERGDNAGSFMDNLALASRSHVNYEDFLRRFATRAEDAKLNDEEFDYIFYTYGLKLYENMPLVEPLEYMETDRIREFVIAIDTSGSCSRGLVQVFLTRTYEILSRGQGFDDRINVHIIQCDAEIQSEVVIHDIGELAEFEQGFEVHGYGGTDFRPVFAYVDELISQKEFSDLRGLVYFTDGYGTFPTKAPDYDVAFVFVEEDGKDRRVPPWAMKVVLDQDTIYEMENQLPPRKLILTGKDEYGYRRGKTASQAHGRGVPRQGRHGLAPHPAS